MQEHEAKQRDELLMRRYTADVSEGACPYLVIVKGFVWVRGWRVLLA